MSCPVKVSFLLALVIVGGVPLARGQNLTQQNNAVIEVFNNCKCVYYYQCDENNRVITNGETLFDVRINVPRIQCEGGTFPSEIVCCKLNDTELKPLEKSSGIEEFENDNEIEKVACGKQKTTINVRIFAGEDELTSMDGEFPWMAAIFVKMPSGNYKFHCTGSLIHRKVILTANHCVNRKKHTSLKVIVNGLITLPVPGSRPEDERGVSEIVSHPDYNAGTLYNDAALLILEAPFTGTKQNYINNLCLPPSNVNLENTRCLVAGWGKDSNGQSQQEMKKVELPFVNFTHCQGLLRKTRLGDRFNLDKSFMCAGGEKGKDACKGDGGSPLMCPLPSDSNRYFQMGIVSWGIGCGDENVPGVYGNVETFTDWIRNELQGRHLKI